MGDYNSTAGSSAPGDSVTDSSGMGSDFDDSDDGSGTPPPSDNDTDFSDAGSAIEDLDNISIATSVSGDGDLDSAIGDSDTESTCTMPDEVPIEENGRTYVNPAKYPLPNDEKEQERLDMLHEQWRVCDGGALVLCPRKKCRHVLDLGTGTGIWAIDFANKYPEAEVIGVDLSVMQPEWVPPNCKFEIDDVEKGWTWRRTFDLIHARMLGGCFKDPRSIVMKAFEYLNPGGYFEARDIDLIPQCDDGTLKDDSRLLEWAGYLDEAARKMGRPINLASQYQHMLVEAGFQDVQVVEKRWPTNGWAKDRNLRLLGRWTQLTVAKELETVSMALLTHGLGWRPEEVWILCALVREEFLDPKVHAYFPVLTVFGMKPKGL